MPLSMKLWMLRNPQKALQLKQHSEELWLKHLLPMAGNAVSGQIPPQNPADIKAVLEKIWKALQ
jgi:hypothetical protein